MLKKYDVLSLGEILLRLSPENNEKISRSNTFEKQVGGAELNVLSGISLLGLKTGMISMLPESDLGMFAKNRMGEVGVTDEYIRYDSEYDSRLGIYYYEGGSFPRKPRIVYDRRNTSFYKLNAEDFPEEMYSSAKCFHTTGITLALNEKMRSNIKYMMKKFKEAGALVSFDVNFRSNLWTGEEAKLYIEEILPYVDVFFCSESTAKLTFNKTGDLKTIMKSFTDEYPISYVVSTQRTVHSPKIHSFGSMIYNAKEDEYYEEEPYEKIEVVDRIGSGDAYISGALYGLIKFNGDCRKAVEFGDACGAIKNTIPGDMSACYYNEIVDVIEAHKSNDESEMKR